MASVEDAQSYVDANLRPGEVAIVPSYSPFEDSRYFELVQIYVEHTPDYPVPFASADHRRAFLRAVRRDPPALLRRVGS